MVVLDGVIHGSLLDLRHFKAQRIMFRLKQFEAVQVSVDFVNSDVLLAPSDYHNQKCLSTSASVTSAWHIPNSYHTLQVHLSNQLKLNAKKE